MREINPESLEAAARAVFPQFASAVTGRAPRFNYDNALHPDRELCDELAKDAVAAFLAAEASRGYALVPRDPTKEMVLACGDTAKKVNPSKKSGNWKAVALDGLSIWRGMFDAAAGPDCLRKGPVETTAVPNEQSKSAPIKPSEKEG